MQQGREHTLKAFDEDLDRLRALISEMGGLAEAYHAHCERWTALAIAADWPGFCADCRQILDALVIRNTRENRELFPLLEGFSRTARAA